jgi:hypothetical protein
MTWAAVTAGGVFRVFPVHLWRTEPAQSPAHKHHLTIGRLPPSSSGHGAQSASSSLKSALHDAESRQAPVYRASDEDLQPVRHT